MVPWNASAADMAPMMPFMASLREQGLFTFVRWNFIFIAPPLTITEAELDAGLAMISKAILLVDGLVDTE